MTAIYVCTKSGPQRWNLTVFDSDGEVVLDAECAVLAPLILESASLPIAITFVQGKHQRWTDRRRQG